MKIYGITPLGGLIGKLLRGEADEWCETDFGLYLEGLTHGDVKKLKRVLKTVDEAIVDWKGLFFISRYEDKIREWEKGECGMDEVDELYFEEESWRKEGRRPLTAETLYAAISSKGFISDCHRDAVEEALDNNDVQFLKMNWEDMALAQIRSFRDVVTGMLEMASVKPVTDRRSVVGGLKKLNDYPEVLDVTLCSEFLGVSIHKLYKLTSAHEIPFYRSKGNGRKLSFKRDEVYEWRMAYRQETNGEFIKRKESELASRLYL